MKLCHLYCRLQDNQMEKQGRVAVYFSLKVRCLSRTMQQMNIPSKKVGSLEAVNLRVRNVQTQFTVCSPELTFSFSIWFHSSVSVGSTLHSFALSFEHPWRGKEKELDLHISLVSFTVVALFRFFFFFFYLKYFLFLDVCFKCNFKLTLILLCPSICLTYFTHIVAILSVSILAKKLFENTPD